MLLQLHTSCHVSSYCITKCINSASQIKHNSCARALKFLQSMAGTFTTLIWMITHYIDSLEYHKEPINFPPQLTDIKIPTSCNYMMDSKCLTLHITVHWKSSTSWILLWSTSIHKLKIITPTNGPSKPMIHRLIASTSIPMISKYTMNHFQIETPIENQSNIIPPHPKMILTIQSRDT